MEKKESFFSEDDPFFDEKTRENIKLVGDLLKKDSKEEEKQKITQYSQRVGYFSPSVKKGDKVRKGNKVGFMRVKGVEKDEIINAQVDGVIEEILSEAQERTTEDMLISVEYGQALFTIVKGEKKE